MSLSDDNASYREHIEGFILRHPIEPVLPVADVPLDPETVHGPRSYFDGRDDGKAAGYAEGFKDGWEQGRELYARGVEPPPRRSDSGQGCLPQGPWSFGGRRSPRLNRAAVAA